MLSTQLSLKDRLLVASNTKTSRSQLLPPSVPADRGTKVLPVARKNWNETNMYKAYLAHVEDNVSVRRAAEMYGVPKSTLQDRISGRVPFGKKSGPTKFLTDEEETELVNFICGCATVGYAKSKQQILSLVSNVVKSKGIQESAVTDGWWRSFKGRNAQLTIRAGEQLSYSRAVATSPEIIARYFDLLEQTLIENELMDSPSQIYNMDETGLPLDPKPSKVITTRGVKHPMTINSGNKAQITVVSVCSASGHVLPPMVIFDRKNLKPELTYGEVPGSIYGLSKNGWIDSELFELWFRNHFLPNVPSVRPLLLIMDGHSSHYQPSVIRVAAKEQILLFCLPPNTTHLLQPLDKGPFGALKKAWQKYCHDFLAINPGRVITRYEVSRLLSKSWFEAMTPANIISSFRCTGIYPFSREAFELPINAPKTPISLEQQTGLSFIPLFTSPGCRTPHQLSDTPSSHRAVPVLKRQTYLTKTLSEIEAPKQIKVPTAKLNNCGRLLTSAENLRCLDQKEKQKQEKKRAIEERKQKRLEKRATSKRNKSNNSPPSALAEQRSPIINSSVESLLKGEYIYINILRLVIIYFIR